MCRFHSILRHALCALAIAACAAYPIQVLGRGGGGGGGGRMGGGGGGFSGFSGGSNFSGRSFTGGGSGFGNGAGFSGGSNFSGRSFMGHGSGFNNGSTFSGGSRNFTGGSNAGSGNGIIRSNSGNPRGFTGGPNFGSGGDSNGNANFSRSGAPSFSNITHSGAQNFANGARDNARSFSNAGNGAGGLRNFGSFQNGFHNTGFHQSFSPYWQQGQHFAQFHGNNFNHFNAFCHRGGCFFTPFCFPWSWGWFGGIGLGLGFDYYSYVPAYCYDSALYGTVVGYNGIVADTSAAAPLAEVAPAAAPAPGNGAVNADANMQGDAQTGAMFFSQAESAFQSAKYRDAFRLANHAAIESPENPRGPELMSLSLFALGEYPAAAAQAHFALSLGPPTDWASIFGYYGDVASYTKQLRALEKYSDDNPQSVEGHFLLGYHYLLTGYTKQAVKELGAVVKLAPNDKLSAALLKKYGGEAAPAQPPVPPAPGATKSESVPSSGDSPPPANPPALPVPILGPGNS